jgi:hypothetical protein
MYDGSKEFHSLGVENVTTMDLKFESRSIRKVLMAVDQCSNKNKNQERYKSGANPWAMESWKPYPRGDQTLVLVV